MLTAPTTTAAASTANSRRVPLDKRKRAETSCDKCKSRKQKCRKEPGQESCKYCTVHNIECQTTQPRKKRLYGSVESLGNRLALLESLVKGLLPEADVSNLEEMRQLGLSLGIALPDSPHGDANGEQNNASGSEEEESLSLLPDQQGQVQFIGPASSFSFHLKLRALCGQSTFREFVLFGKNPAEQASAERNSDSRPGLSRNAFSAFDYNSPGHQQRMPAAEAATYESLVVAYFEHVNADFPILHEPSFREAYEGWLVNPAKADLAWQCSFLCVLLLARRVGIVHVTEEQEKLWWERIQTVLPVVIFTSSVTAVQALMLAAVHLHNTNHRDACWNLTGTAIRIAFAIGLHQDKASLSQTPLARELRKRLWWTLYAFEQLQVSSYDRPSAIEHNVPKISCSNERILGSSAIFPPDYFRWMDRMVVHLGSVCRAPKQVKSNSSDESYAGPLSPAAGVLRELERWKSDLPQHLRLEAVDASPPIFHRPVLLLHALHHYTVTVLCRAALLARATTLLKENRDSTNVALIGMSDACTDSGRILAEILLKLDAIGKLNVTTWGDTWYALASSSVLVLNLVCLQKTGGDASESRIFLSQLAEVTRRHLRNRHMPGTLAKFASLVMELHSVTNSMVASQTAQPDVRSESVSVNQALHSQQQVPPFAYSQTRTNNGAYVFADNVPGRYYPEAEFSAAAAYSNTRDDRSTQMQFMDFTINNIHDWNWGDVGNLLGNDGAPGHQVAPGPPGSARGSLM